MAVDTEAACNVIEENLSELKQAVTDIQSEINE